MATATADLKSQLKAGFDARIETVLAKYNEFKAMLTSQEKALFGKSLMTDGDANVATLPAPKKGTPGRKPGRPPGKAKEGATGETPAATPAGEAAVRPGTLKALVLDIVEKSPEGLKLAEITAQVQQAKDEGKYETEATNLTNNVGQAVHQLSKAGKIKKSDTDHKKYIVA